MNKKMNSLLLNRPLMMEQSRLNVLLADQDSKMELETGANVPHYGFSVVEGIAVIPVAGVLTHRPYYSHYYEMTSYQMLAVQIMEAAQDPGIKSILLDIDSGGGEVEGVFDLAEIIKDVSDNIKPVYGIANGAAFSAAYAIGVACEQLFVTRTGGVGSIGVVAEHIDISKMNEAAGLKVTPIYAGERKVERSPDFPISDQAKARIQGEVDDTYEMFLEHVAAMNPGLSVDEARATQAGLFFGSNAVESKLANAIMNFDDTILFILETQDDLGLNQQMNLSQTGKGETMKFLKDAKEYAPKQKGEAKDDAAVLEKDALVDEAEKEAIKEDAEQSAEVKEAEEKAEEKEADAEAKADNHEDMADDEAEEKEGEDKEAEADAEEKAEEKGESQAANHIEITKLAIDAGAPEMLPSIFEQGLNIAEAKIALDKAGRIKGYCDRAGRQDLAESFINQDLSVEDVQAKLIDSLVAAHDETHVSNKPDANAIDNEVVKGYTSNNNESNPLVANAEKRAKS